MQTTFDVVIIGAGQAADPLAGALAKAGRRVAVVERKHLGGSCVNFGCTPSKAVIASANVAQQARRAGEYGVRVPTVEVDFPAVLARAKRMAQESRDGLVAGLDSTEHLTLLRGHARLAGRDGTSFCIDVGDTTIRGAQVVLDTGTRSIIPPIDGLDGVAYLHAENWLAQEDLPTHLVILGGGYIGLEMSQFYRRMGSRVTIVEAGSQVASHED